VLHEPEHPVVLRELGGFGASDIPGIGQGGQGGQGARLPDVRVGLTVDEFGNPIVPEPTFVDEEFFEEDPEEETATLRPGSPAPCPPWQPWPIPGMSDAPKPPNSRRTTGCCA
jgi:hypothetical protein